MQLEVGKRRCLVWLLPVLLMAVGTCLLVYVGFQYSRMYFEQRRLANEWERQQLLASQPSAPIPTDTLTRLAIPKIKLDAVVVEGTSRRALLLGPGHIKDTPEPGQSGNAVITAHRDTFFRHIYELDKGDVVRVQRHGKVYTYEVTGKKIVSPDDVSVIEPSRENRLTLITCYPTYYIGPAPQRLVVFSNLVPQSADLSPEPIRRAATR